MEVKASSTEFEIDEVPLEKMYFGKEDEFIVEFDDVTEKRISLEFGSHQAIKITTIDCFDVNSLLINGRLERRVLEVIDSEWVKELKKELWSHDHTATFMDKAHHYVLPLGDNIVEIIAWGMK